MGADPTKLPAGSAVPITLEITLNGEGHIVIPPRIVRPNTEAPNERRLIAEARALAAVSAFVPYKGSVLGTGQGLSVRFRKLAVRATARVL